MFIQIPELCEQGGFSTSPDSGDNNNGLMGSIPLTINVPFYARFFSHKPGMVILNDLVKREEINHPITNGNLIMKVLSYNPDYD
jgi:hypothetical protein